MVSLELNDKIWFTLGIVYIVLIQHIVLCAPELMPLFYITVVGALVFYRFLAYKSCKWGWFLYWVVAYLVNTWLTVNSSVGFFQSAFALCNGPLLFSVPLWHNSLVFHDLDRMTSVSIHFVPGLVSYCMRLLYPHSEPISLFWMVVVPIIYYVLWQVLYLLLTEVVFAKHIATTGQFTSLIWLSKHRPHPVYVFFRNHGYKGSALVLLIGVQFVYTAAALFASVLALKWLSVHILMLVVVFIIAAWNGACFYIEAFAKEQEKKRAENGDPVHRKNT